MPFLNDVREIIGAFAPEITVGDYPDYLRWRVEREGAKLTLFIESNVFGNRQKSITADAADIWEYKRRCKRFIKHELYKLLSEKLRITLPYGSLTGVRPTKLYRESEREGDPEKILSERFGVSEERIALIADCVKNQEKYINKDKNAVGIYVNIPFCPTRCSYCSFISTEVKRIEKRLPEYVRCVKRELDAVLKIIAAKGFKPRHIYVGGGTPPSIGSGFLREIISPLVGKAAEFTVEAGRPDAIDAELAETLSDCGVTRVSVNPQSFHQKTLDKIGRRHTVEQFYEAYNLVAGKFAVNADLICGLPGESEEDFAYSLGEILKLRPENVTIHNLTAKRGSVLAAEGAVKRTDGLSKKMSGYAYGILRAEGYFPYYMYRQKNTADNLENVGFSLGGFPCLYNVDMMEESASVLAAGAGAMNKTVGEKIERFSNPKGFEEYCGRIDEIVEKKFRFFNL